MNTRIEIIFSDKRRFEVFGDVTISVCKFSISEELEGVIVGYFCNIEVLAG